jgi:nicotinamidase/pyrazinamidase
MMSTALIVVDVQNDFCEGGALAVAGGSAVAEAITEYVSRSAGRYDVVVATRDWHAPLPDTNDGHFAADSDPDYVTSWPVHCVAGTAGAQYHPRLALPESTVHVVKGESRQDYSGFSGRIVDQEGVDLAAELSARGVTAVDVVGLATDHCVRATALDASDAGFEVVVLTDLTAAVAAPTAVAALTDLATAGVGLARSS